MRNTILLTAILLISFGGYSQMMLGLEVGSDGFGINGIINKNMISVRLMPVQSDVKIGGYYYREIAKKDQLACGYIGLGMSVDNSNNAAKSINLPARLQITALDWIQFNIEIGPSVYEKITTSGMYDQGVYYTFTDRSWQFGTCSQLGVIFYFLRK